MTTGGGGASAPPGWYPDGEGWERRWDGVAWTADRRPAQAGAPGQPGQPGQQAQDTRPFTGGAAGAPTAPPPRSRPGYGALPPDPRGFGGAQQPPAQHPQAQHPPAQPVQSGRPQGPPYAGPGAYGGAPYAPSQPPRKKSLLWLWVVLAVVLVVIVAGVVALLVVQPWDDDEGGGGGGGSDDPTSEAPAAEEAVTGDLDGDGLGDVVGRRYDDTESRLLLTNTEGAFEPTTELVGDREELFIGSFTGDGSAQIATMLSADGRLQLEIEGSEMAPVTAEFDLWHQVQEVGATVGDFDGDGLTDIAAYGQHRRGQVAIWVLRNNGEGFDDPAQWAELQNATYGSTQLLPGDFDGDGADDLIAIVPDQPIQKGEYKDTYWYGDFGTRGLMSASGEFEVGEISSLENLGIVSDAVAVGDFDGDGTDSVATGGYRSIEVSTFDGDTLRPSGEVPTSEVGEGLTKALTTSDVDGDGIDDVVFAIVDVDDYTFSGAWVAPGEEGDGLGTPSKWADIEPCSGDYCEVTFYPAS